MDFLLVTLIMMNLARIDSEQFDYYKFVQVTILQVKSNQCVLFNTNVSYLIFIDTLSKVETIFTFKSS